MPETLNSAYVTAKDAIHSASPWVWLFQIQSDSGNAFRVCGYDAPITWGGNVYSAFPVVVSSLGRSAEGVLSQPQVTISNITREVAAQLEAGNLVDQAVQMRLVLSTDLSTSIDFGKFQILDATLTLEACTFTLGVYNLFDAQIPAQRFTRTRCPYIYGGPECGYNKTLTNLIAATRPNFDGTTCDLTVEGGNGCRAHGENEVAHGLPEKHPLRYGGFPSIPRGPARV